jgi:hypothetical protein
MMHAGRDYGVEVILAYENRIVGQVFYPPALLRDALVRSGRVKRRAPPPDVLERIGGEEQSVGRGRRRDRLAMVTK